MEGSLKDTQALIIYQEGAIRVAKDIAGFSLQQGDLLRKSMGKKLPELMAELRVKFLEGCSNKNRKVKVGGWHGELIDPPYKLVDSTAWIEGVEKELMGIAITCDSVNKKTNANFNCRSFINKDKHTGPIIISGTLTETREIRTKKGKNPGQKMCLTIC